MFHQHSILRNRPVFIAPTTVNLGDWYRSDLEKDQTTEVPFQITELRTGTIEVSFVAKSSYTNAIRTCSPTDYQQLKRYRGWRRRRK